MTLIEKNLTLKMMQSHPKNWPEDGAEGVVFESGGDTCQVGNVTIAGLVCCEIRHIKLLL